MHARYVTTKDHIPLPPGVKPEDEARTWEWQCLMFIYSCALYQADEECVMSDSSFDQHCQMLLRAWDRLPAWFTERVEQGNLTAGTTVGLSFTQQETDDARAWRKRAFLANQAIRSTDGTATGY